MLSYAYHSLQEQDAVNVDVEEFEHIYDLYAAILVKGIANLLRKGLSREYIEQKDELGSLRGRIDLTESLKKQTMRNRRLVCTFDEFSEDFYMNRILKTVSYALITNENVKKDNKRALKKLLLSFSNVRSIALSSIQWNRCHIHRNNATYQMLINICYLTVKGLLMTTEPGDLTVMSYFDEQQMHRLYEKFVLEYYRRWYREYKPASRKISWNVMGATKFLPSMQSDIMLSDGNRKLIIDTKYYSKIMQNYYGKETFHSNNLYQIYTYVKNQDIGETGDVSGLLLYAKTEDSFDLNTDYLMGKNRIGVMTLDLGVSFERIREQLDFVISKYFGE